jgi:acylphosphatase
MVTKRIIVTGVVQGVGYRFFVLDLGTRLGLAGYARNLVDGSVEVVAQGEADAVASLVEELRVGPRAAHVSGLDVEAIENPPDLGPFEIRF